MYQLPLDDALRHSSQQRALAPLSFWEISPVCSFLNSLRELASFARAKGESPAAFENKVSRLPVGCLQLLLVDIGSFL